MNAAATPRTAGEWWHEISRRFQRTRLVFGHGTSNAHDEAAWLVCNVLRIPFDDLACTLDQIVGASAARRIDALASRRIETRAPLAYLVREAWLQDRRFYVDRRVIVPRSHIAELLPDSLAPWLRGRSPRRILDLCTGSGCIAILAALAFPRSRVDASDISATALAVARRNVASYRLCRRVRLVQSDLFAALGRARYDLILCNPPYVPERDMRRLPPEYRHEPALALASGRDGLDFIRRLLAEALAHLTADGLLVVEVGEGRRVVERVFPRLALTWLETSAGSGLVFVATARELRG
ncbi:MAG TPA: 50S ribosomal protein L3 N(5)-glutamine methyltransferase [Burkholderiales bacterium]|nr:50S ribosomal protein L3 N(5)-glutamine methyltransferase [Burkholderiales bacterium]